MSFYTLLFLFRKLVLLPKESTWLVCDSSTLANLDYILPADLPACNYFYLHNFLWII